MNLYNCMQTHSTCYRNTEKMTIKGILWHSTGANNPNIKRYVQPYETDANYKKDIEKLGKNSYNNDWNHIEHQAGLNAWIGKFADGTVGICQTMPWDYCPWGCGSGSKGSCNSGWIQFEICEDSLNDKDYAEKVWNEAIELSVYLCKMYNLDPNGTVNHNGVKCPVITCHNDAAKIGLAGNHVDINHWFPKILGKDMSNARKEISEKLNSKPSPQPTPTPTPTEELYRVRKSWSDAKSQTGAYKILNNAKKSCAVGYSVFDSKGNVVYSNNPTPQPQPTPQPTPTPKKSVEEIAKEVIAGNWGNGEDRKSRLEKAGYNYSEIQNKVNELLNPKTITKKVKATSGLWLHNRATTSSSTRTICIPYGTAVTVKSVSGSMSYISCVVRGKTYTGYVATIYIG